jgi:hypothetical protein
VSKEAYAHSSATGCDIYTCIRTHARTHTHTHTHTHIHTNTHTPRRQLSKRMCEDRAGPESSSRSLPLSSDHTYVVKYYVVNILVKYHVVNILVKYHVVK